jgi:hypothetical protein
MSASVELVLLKCPQCGTPVPAEEDEVAWTCATCGAGLLLTDDGLKPLKVQWAERRHGTAAWRPFWVIPGSVQFTDRQSFGRAAKPDEVWSGPVRFFVPAFPASLQEIEELGARMTRGQPTLTPGPPQGPIRQCVLLPEDARQAAEFIVLTIEAERKDKLRSLRFSLSLGEPELWMLLA